VNYLRRREPVSGDHGCRSESNRWACVVSPLRAVWSRLKIRKLS